MALDGELILEFGADVAREDVIRTISRMALCDGGGMSMPMVLCVNKNEYGVSYNCFREEVFFLIALGTSLSPHFLHTCFTGEHPIGGHRGTPHYQWRPEGVFDDCQARESPSYSQGIGVQVYGPKGICWRR